jgi:hypothetical protein
MPKGDLPNLFQERALRQLEAAGGVADSRKVPIYPTVKHALMGKGFIEWGELVYGPRGGVYETYRISDYGKEWLSKYPIPHSCYRIGVECTVNKHHYVFYATLDKTIPSWTVEWRSKGFYPDDTPEVRKEIERRLANHEEGVPITWHWFPESVE